MLHPSTSRSLRDALCAAAALCASFPFPRVAGGRAWLAAAPALVSVAAVHAAGAQHGAPTVVQVERAIDQRLQKLKPDGESERNVLFQSVRAGSPSGGNYPYRVTMVVRDYGTGYPANHFYGETCVARFEEKTFTAEPDSFGGWSVTGRFTPDLSRRTCTRNPSAGVSSVPLAGLSGTSVTGGSCGAQPEPAGDVRSEAPRGGQSGLAAGSYACWTNGQARPLMNLTVRDGARYVGADGKEGHLSIRCGDRERHVCGGRAGWGDADGFLGGLPHGAGAADGELQRAGVGGGGVL